MITLTLSLALLSATHAADDTALTLKQASVAAIHDEIAAAERAVMTGERALGDVPGMDAIQATACGQAGADYWRYLTPDQAGFDGPEALFVAYRQEAVRVGQDAMEMVSNPDWGPFRGAAARQDGPASPFDEAVGRARLDQAVSQIFHPAAARGESVELMAAARHYCNVFESNTAFLRETTARAGYPALSEHGETVQAAFNLLAIHHQDRSLAETIREAADDAFARGELAPARYAQLRDFTAMLLEGEQIFGFYHACEDGQSVFRPPLRDRETADQIRAALGLPSLAEREARMTERMRCADQATAAPAG